MTTATLKETGPGGELDLTGRVAADSSVLQVYVTVNLPTRATLVEKAKLETWARHGQAQCADPFPPEPDLG